MLTLTELARLLGVSTNQVWTWHDRRDRNGFPASIGCCIAPKGGGRKRSPMFDPQTVVEWWVEYEPMARHGKHWASKRAS